jgi:hypothetical protein
MEEAGSSRRGAPQRQASSPLRLRHRSGVAGSSRSSSGTPPRQAFGRSAPPPAGDRTARRPAQQQQERQRQEHAASDGTRRSPQAAPLRRTLQEVQDIMAEMEALCGRRAEACLPRPPAGGWAVGGGPASAASGDESGDDVRPGDRRQRTTPGSPAGARRKAAAACAGSPEEHALRGRVHGMQQRLERLEGRMLRAGALGNTPCVADAACKARPGGAPGGGSPGGRAGGLAPCRAGCADFAQPRRAALVEAMQEDVAAMEGELRGLRASLPGAYQA